MNENPRLIGTNDRNASSNLLENEADIFLHSESPRAQQIRLYQKLREEIENNSNGRVRYIDSELYLRNQSPAGLEDRSSSEVQSTTVSFANQAEAADKIVSSASKSIVCDRAGTSRLQLGSTSTASFKTAGKNPHEQNLNGAESKILIGVGDNDLKEEITGNMAIKQQGGVLTAGTRCQVCLVREVKEDLIGVTKLIQERNEQLIKLKARRLRSFFERQMLD